MADWDNQKDNQNWWEKKEKDDWSGGDNAGANTEKWGGDDWKADEATTGSNGWDNSQQDNSQASAAQDPWQPEAQAPADPWAAAAASKSDDWGNSSSWGNGNAKADSWGASADPVKGDGKAFWEAQEYYKSNGTLPRKQDWEMESDDSRLFQERLGNDSLDFSRYDSVPVEVSGQKSDAIPVVDSFERMYTEFKECIPDALVDNVRRCMYNKPTPVQKYAIPVGLVGRDVMCCAQTGSGKTAAFLFPVIGRMMQGLGNPVGGLTEPFQGACKPDTLILSPTRELCIQIHEEALKFCHRTPYRCDLCYGGKQTKDQMWEIAKGADVLVATPGRLNDFIGRGIVGVDQVAVLVLDEADRMLDMGFEVQIREICEEHSMPSKENRQTMMFSATFPEKCQVMAQDFLFDYIWIGVGIIGGAVDTVEQELRKVSPKEKYEALFEVLDEFFEKRADKERVLVFVNAKNQARWLDEQLHEKNYDTGALHGDLTQQEREDNLRRFRNGDTDVMIATDVASRGLDIEKVGMVINYDFPNKIDDYVHRIGRTGRIGHEGRAVSYISVDEFGNCLEKADVLQALLGIMQDAKSQIPEWLEPLVSATAAGTWATGGDGSWDKWGGKDARKEWSKDEGGGNDWSNWSRKEETSW